MRFFCGLQLADACRITLACGQFSLSWAPDAQALHAFSDKQVTVASLTELFGFGSGDFVQSGEADDVMSDVRGKRWEFNLTNPDCLAILEPDRKLPDHLRGVGALNKAKLMLLICISLASFSDSFQILSSTAKQHSAVISFSN